MKLTIKSIAEKAGVSVSTVSKILNNYSEVSEETRQRVLNIMDELGYRSNHSVKATTNNANLIGVIFAGKINSDLNHPFFVDVINSFKRKIGSLGYDLLFLSNENFRSTGTDYLARCRDHQVDGCLVIAGEELEASISELDKSDIPCIGIDIEMSGERAGYIMSDNSKISHKVVEHFYLQGYKDIGFIGGAQKSFISQLRENSFVTAIKNFGLTVNPQWFINGADFFEESGYTAMKSMIEKESLPRAIFASSDFIAIGAIRALKEHGFRVPLDVAVIGCDNIEMCRHLSPQLTTVRQVKEKIGILAALMLFDLINKELQSTSVLVESELVIRQSCGARQIT